MNRICALLVGGTVLVTGGCAGSASLVLKAPLKDQCVQAGLQGCDEISEGVLLYVEGKKDEGLHKVTAGTAKNAPENVRRYAELLKTLESVPGTSKYYVHIAEIVDLLSGDGQGAGAGIVAAGDRAHGGGVPTSSGSATADFQKVLTADTDTEQIRSGAPDVPSVSPEWCVSQFGVGVKCRTLRRGPLIVTDATSTGARCEGQVLAVLSSGVVSAHLEGPLRIHGARVPVSASEVLVLAQRPQPKPDESVETADAVVLDEDDPAYLCGVFWSGFVPYE